MLRTGTLKIYRIPYILLYIRSTSVNSKILCGRTVQKMLQMQSSYIKTLTPAALGPKLKVNPLSCILCLYTLHGNCKHVVRDSTMG